MKKAFMSLPGSIHLHPGRGGCFVSRFRIYFFVVDVSLHLFSTTIVFPPTVRPGEVVDLKMTYAVLHPTPNTKTRITEIREISYRGELVGRPEVNVEQSDGTYTTTVPLRLPSNAARGTYRVKSMVQSPNAKDTRETTFTVLQ
jgi:hypothetical protein